MGYIIKSKRYKMQDQYKYDVRAPRSPLSAALKIQAKLQVLLQQCVVLLPHHRVSLQHQRENGQRRSQAAAVQHHQLLHARVGQAYHQEQLSKLLTVLKQVHHDTTMPSSYYSRLPARNHDWRVGAPVKEAGK